MIYKKLVLLLLLVPLAFAGWESLAAVAIVTSAIMLGVLYAVGMGFGVNELQLMAKEELFQLIALMIMMVVLVGANGLLNSLSSNQAFGGSLQDSAKSIITDTKAQVTDVFDLITIYDRQSSIEASKATQCNILGMGYSVSACGGFSMLATPLSMAGGIAGFAIGELAAMDRLIEISKVYALTFLLPFGIVLRTFKVSRGAGGFIIALAISMHLLLPIGVIFNEMMSATFLTDPAAAEYNKPPIATIPECNAADTKPPPFAGSNINSENIATLLEGSNEDRALGAYLGLRTDIRSYLAIMLIKATLGPVIALLLMMVGLRTLTSLAGAEVDVTALSRFV